MQFVASILVSKWYPSTKMYDMLPVSWSVAGVLVSKWCPSTRMYDLLPVSWSRSDAPELRFSVSLSRRGAPAVRYTICCRCLGFEVVPQHEDVRFVAGVLVSKCYPSTKMHDLSPVSWSRSGAPALRCTICCRYLGLEVVPQH